MNILFLTLISIENIQERGIYHDLLRKFKNEGHDIFVIYPVERRRGLRTDLRIQEGISLLQVRTLNIQKASVIEKGIGTILLEYQYQAAFKKYFADVHFDLVVYSTPPITFTRLIKDIKRRTGALTYLLLKDIFPQNAVDLGLLRSGSYLHELFKKKEKELYKISDYIGCMSSANVEFIKRYHREVTEKKIEVNPNSIELIPTPELSKMQKQELKCQFGLPKNSTVCIYGGNLGKPQGIEFLLRVLEYWQNFEQVFFIIIGSGTEFPKLSKWMAERNPKNIRLFPFLPKGEYDELIKLCDIGLIFLDKRFTIPNFPSRLLSYLENRMPVLCAIDKHTDLGRVLEENNAGLWSESGNLVKFNENLRDLIGNKKRLKEMGNAGYELLKKEYSVDKSYELIINKVEQRFV